MTDTGMNHQAVKTGNKALVLRKLHEDGPMSRTELAKSCGLSKMTITNRIQELLEANDIREMNPDGSPDDGFHGQAARRLAAHNELSNGSSISRSGRKPILLETVPDARHAVSLYISRDRIEAAVFNWHMQEKASHTEPFPTADTTSGFRQRLLLCVDNVLSTSGLSSSELNGIGVAMIGPLDFQNGILLNPPNFHELAEIPIRSWLETAYGVPVFVDNDMNASAVAELHFGHGKGLRSFLYVGVTNGIGSGIVQEGRLFRGFAGYAGELGHMTVSLHGPACSCGNTGCLELFASIPAMVAAINGTSPDQPKLNWQEIAAAEQQGDPHTHEVLSECFHYLSAGLVNAINLLDPQAIFLGHELALAGDSILAVIRPDMHRRVLAQQHRNIPIAFSAFRHRSPVYGGAALVFDALLHEPMG